MHDFCLFFIISFLFTSSSLDSSVHLFLVLVFYFFGVHFFFVFSFSSKIKVFFPLVYQVEMLATEVRTLHQNKIYSVQFALKQMKTSIYLLYLDLSSCKNLPPKQCCPRLLYPSSLSFFSFLSFDFFLGVVFYSFLKSTSSFALNSSCLSNSFSSFSIFFLWYIYIIKSLFFFLRFLCRYWISRSHKQQQSRNAHCFWTNFLQKSLVM